MPDTPAPPGHVVVVGAGQAGVQFADSLRDAGHTGPLTLVEAESGLPYQRPPLSKDHLAEAGDRSAVPLRGRAFYADRDITLHGGARVVGLDRLSRRLAFDDGSSLGYTTLVLATGSTNRALDVPGAGLAGIHALRTHGDAQRLRDDLDRARSIVVVGAGFVGLECAAAARARGLAVTVLEAAGRPLGRGASPEISAHVAAEHRRQGTDLRLGVAVAAVEGAGGRVVAVRDSVGARHAADLVLVGIGAVPSDRLAAEAGIDADAGVLVDATLRTCDPDVYAIGDCARFPSAQLGVPVRLESVQNAAEQGRHLARTLLDLAAGGPGAPFSAVPWFWSHQGQLRLQIAGLAVAGDHRVPCGDVAGGSFSVLSYRDGRLVAVESVNRPADHLAARTLLAAGRGPRPEAVTAPGFDLRRFSRAPAAVAAPT